MSFNTCHECVSVSLKKYLYLFYFTLLVGGCSQDRNEFLKPIWFEAVGNGAYMSLNPDMEYHPDRRKKLDDAAKLLKRKIEQNANGNSLEARVALLEQNGFFCDLYLSGKMLPEGVSRNDFLNVRKLHVVDKIGICGTIYSGGPHILFLWPWMTKKMEELLVWEVLITEKDKQIDVFAFVDDLGFEKFGYLTKSGALDE